MNRHITLLSGVSCSGKEEVSKDNRLRLNYGARCSGEFFNIHKKNQLMRIETYFKNTVYNSVLFEGYPFWKDTKLDLIHKYFDSMDNLITYAPLFLLKERQTQKGVKLSEKEMMEVYYLIYHYQKNIPCINTGSAFKLHNFTLPEFVEEWEKINQKPTNEDELSFMATLPNKSWADKQYNDVELPHNFFKGTITPSETWNRIKDMGISFKDKTVVDVGCHQGYYLFKAKEEGAKRCIGYERNEKIVNNAKHIAWLKQSPVDFLLRDISYHNLPKRDIVICMNMIHYTEMDLALPRIFNVNTNEVVFQCDLGKHTETVELIAKENNFEVIKKENDRPNRNIIWFKRR